ncbi:hypothetical protein GQ55_9G572700 [Panicum hallii var. hallii]|uniref:Uncharacterized protein n=1 Tax=Panicum hallii var. hallii TaxID=1504633 RepID=A0A2T7CG29_9POAL|nr:hypothetical protein GQ55_9G572700 [Panicum hallii var. hallii]
MGSNNVQNHVDDDDRFSKLPDDILLHILGKTNIMSSIRASFSSTRWRHLPSLLPHIYLSIWDFILSHDTLTNNKVVDEAMAAMTKAARICLAAPGSERAMKTASLDLCLTANYLYDIGELVCEATDNGNVKSVELALPTSSDEYCDGADMMQHANNLVCFFDAFPNLFQCITKLELYSARFSELEMHQLLDSCEQLQHLELNNCDTGNLSVLKIDMPNSKISYLRLVSCRFEKIEFLCLPKLSVLYCESWNSFGTPLYFGYVPCLEDLSLVCCALNHQSGLNLSELLHGSTNIKVLTLDFYGEKIWMLPEGKKLCTSFNKLTKMFIHGIHVNFGLLWTIALLETAPSLKTFGIEVWNHMCDVATEETRIAFSKRTNPWQKRNKFKSSGHLQLTSLEFVGFMAIKKHMKFIRGVMDCASSLETVLLQDKDPCETCDAVSGNLTCCPTGWMFPKNKYEQDMILDQLGIGVSFSTQIIFKT